jgi:hypothetical protein
MAQRPAPQGPGLTAHAHKHHSIRSFGLCPDRICNPFPYLIIIYPGAVNPAVAPVPLAGIIQQTSIDAYWRKRRSRIS